MENKQQDKPCEHLPWESHYWVDAKGNEHKTCNKCGKQVY